MPVLVWLCPCGEKHAERGKLMDDRARGERQIAGALKSAIDVYGPIDRSRVGSAAKRIYGALASEGWRAPTST